MPPPARVAAACEYFGACGGCHYQHARYEDQLGYKAGILRETLARTAKLDWTGERLRSLGVQQILGAHCTGIEAVFRLRASAGLDRRTCVVGGVGCEYESGRGITPGLLAR